MCLYSIYLYIICRVLEIGLYGSVVLGAAVWVGVIKLPLGWNIIFFKNRLYDLGSMPELGATGSLGGIVCVG